MSPTSHQPNAMGASSSPLAPADESSRLPAKKKAPEATCMRRRGMGVRCAPVACDLSEPLPPAPINIGERRPRSHRRPSAPKRSTTCAANGGATFLAGQRASVVAVRPARAFCPRARGLQQQQQRVLHVPLERLQELGSEHAVDDAVVAGERDQHHALGLEAASIGRHHLSERGGWGGETGRAQKSTRGGSQ